MVGAETGTLLAGEHPASTIARMPRPEVHTLISNLLDFLEEEALPRERLDDADGA